jgi:hypothetical protein
MEFEKIQITEAQKRIYERAAKALESVPFARAKKPVYLTCVWFVRSYHVVSLAAAMLAIFGGVSYMVGFKTGFIGFASVAILGLILSGVAFGIEVLRHTYYKQLGKQRIKGKVTVGTFLIVLIVFIASAAISGFGGFYFQHEMQDARPQITQKERVLRDSIQGKYNPSIDGLNKELATHHRKMASTNLDYRHKEISDAIALTQYNLNKQDSLMRIDLSNNNITTIDETASNESTRFTFATYAIACILFLEILAIICNISIFWYYDKCAIEAAAINSVNNVRKPLKGEKLPLKPIEATLQPLATNSKPLETVLIAKDAPAKEAQAKPLANAKSKSAKRLQAQAKYPAMCESLKPFIGKTLSNVDARKIASSEGVSEATVRRTLNLFE